MTLRHWRRCLDLRRAAGLIETARKEREGRRRGLRYFDKTGVCRLLHDECSWRNRCLPRIQANEAGGLELPRRIDSGFVKVRSLKEAGEEQSGDDGQSFQRSAALNRRALQGDHARKNIHGLLTAQAGGNSDAVCRFPLNSQDLRLDRSVHFMR